MTQKDQPQVTASRGHPSIVPTCSSPPRKRGPYSKRRPETPEELDARRASILRAFGEYPRLAL